ncbi:MAG TPA: hypothetical protein VHL98_05210 [Microvirga sp.]|jgi:hypothetical protein|nr:hypothetical protein [Microvirga sp.]
MLVYGDAERIEGTRERIDDLERALAGCSGLASGIERHGALVAAFILAAELVQGLADAAFAARGCDAGSAAEDEGLRLLMGLAGAVDRSWRSGFADPGALPGGPLDGLRRLDLPPAIRAKQAEGYAFYALYPEAYLEAARGLAGVSPVRVIGIRSIGVGLAALVAAALGAPAPLTVRPVGHPFQRRLSVSPERAAAIRAEAGATFAIVDEGPGLSGSSFGAVADWLEANGVARERIHAFPSHRGDLGPQASAAHRERWAALPRHVVDFEDLVLRASAPAHRLESWAADLVGPALAPLEDLSGGAWRERVHRDEAEWPAANIQQERRKVRLCTPSGLWLLKFAGLGREGAAKAERGRRLFEAGFTPETAGFRHGFLVERWVEDATPIDLARLDRPAFLDWIARYLAFRARHLPASRTRGAGAGDLLAMARHNAGQALGEEAASALGAWEARVPALEAAIRRVDTDNRLHVQEWLQRRDGSFLKTDALDHSAAHDLVGCQDIAWDVAGAAVELNLSEDETAALRAAVGRGSGHPVDPDLLAFCRVAYPAFQLGAATLAAQALAGCPAEAARLRRAAERYGRSLRERLAVPAITRPRFVPAG